jgi:PIN domain
MELGQLARLALQVGIIEALPIHVQEIVGFVVDAPGGAHAVIAELGRLVRGVPALHQRKVGDAVHPERESTATLAHIRQTVGEYVFASQYQQNPTPLGGAMVRTKWLRYYDPGECPVRFDEVGAIFAKYFGRKPPFDGEDSKEFPDAFVIEALARWAETQDDKVHVVTEDKAMTRAVEADPRLLALKTIHDVLTRAAAELGAQAEAIADALLNHPALDTTLERLLKAQMKEASYVYTGDLAEGEAYEGELLAIEAVGNWSVVSLNADRISLILDVTVKVRVEVQFEDRDSAFYDREDDRWFGVENASTKVEDEVDVEVLVEVSRNSGEVVSAKVLTGEIEVSGRSGYD